jgi:hypothetical protein
MKKYVSIALGLCLAASLVASKPCSAGFAVGGENGWQLTTDGIVDVFATYNTTSPHPGAGSHTLGLLDNTGSEYNQRFGIGVGLLPSVVAFNIKAPTTNGIDSTVRIGIYPSIQNGDNANLGLANSDRFSVGSNIDFREMFYTAKGKYGELLAGKALNLYQAKNILTDMTLLTAGTVGLRAHTVTLGHIGYGYLYTGFGPQMRYTTPDFGGAKLAIAIAEPYSISDYSDKTNTPRVEAELSFAKTFGPGVSTQAWLAGLYQAATRQVAGNRFGKNVESIGGAYGVSFGFKGLSLLGSGYGGRGLGTVSAQDGPAKIAGLFAGSTDDDGKGRLGWGFLLQATYKITPSIMIGTNYGQTRLEETDLDSSIRTSTAPYALIKNQESAVFSVTYNLNAFTQFVGEYIYAQNTWHDGAKQHSNQFALGTMFYW